MHIVMMVGYWCCHQVSAYLDELLVLSPVQVNANIDELLVLPPGECEAYWVTGAATRSLHTLVSYWCCQ